MLSGICVFGQEPSQKMEKNKEKRTYNTSGMEKKPVENSFKNNNNNNEVKIISKKKFKSYPVEKRQAILNNPEKYIIED